MQKIKAVGNRYKIQKKLFKVNSYMYAQIFDKCTLDTTIGCVVTKDLFYFAYIYENQQPGQILKMISQKFTIGQILPNLIFPQFHIKDNINDKSISIFFMQHKIVPIELFKQQQYNKIDLSQMLKFTYDSLCSLHHLHSHDIVHGNISLTTSYISKSLQKNKQNIDFALNILDTSTFHEQLLKIHESLLFKSQSQHNCLKTSFKDDAESMIYVLIHLISKGKMFTENRYKLEWVNQNQLLRWKTMDFFKQMVQILPEQLQFISQIYIDIKTLSRNQKPDYPKYIKRAYTKMKQAQNNQKIKKLKSANSISIIEQNDNQNQNSQQKQQLSNSTIRNTNKSMKKVGFTFEKQKDSQKNINLSKQKQKQKQKQKKQQININEVQQEQVYLIMDNDQTNLHQKYSKLQSTKYSFKNKSLLDDSII